MIPHSNRRPYLLALLLPLVALPFSCESRPAPFDLPHELSELSTGPVGPSYSMTGAGGALRLVVPEYETLSLRLSVLPESGEAENLSLDRINQSQEIDSLFGNHLYFLQGGREDVFYLDQEKEDRRILKWISRSGPDARWNVDVLPLAGRLVSGWSDERGRLTLFLQDQDTLYYSRDAGLSSFEPLLAPFSLEGEVTLLDGSAASGFTAFDGSSGQLFLVRGSDRGPETRPLIRGGRVHHAVLGSDGLLRILAYEPRKTELVLYREDESGRFRSTAVTPCQGTTSVSLIPGSGGERFLFNERIVAEEGRRVYQVSLIYPTRSGYRKAVVYSSEEPIQSFRAVVNGSRLYVAVSQDRLRLITADLGRLPLS